ncbi:flagellar motor switch phosphatase FliY [Ammoniphilus resinae]|uniref:Flagellar motor switch protein FliN/FliY n=1 Tax=Ammoniphilus resinae TaxID=861532 RepID=A0ABS4GMK8_9BACL|nr:flagellar motor switch phosphatase FliY [Ammoniphilus resinae]MBP1931508.1 flagellar motor switch protein FliN/FliY [Ammoniphilus resinae]
MSDNKILSQEEINALLSGNFGEELEEIKEEEKKVEVNDYLTSLEQDALGEIGNISLGNAATSLSILLGQDVDITTPTIEVLLQRDLADKFPRPHVSINVNYTDGFQGMNLLVLKEEDAKIIADLMMGGGGTAEQGELSELHISAVQEAMNQMMGSAATSMSTLFNRMVNISPPGIQVLDFSAGDDLYIEEQIIVNVSFQLKIGTLIDSNIMQLIPLSFAKGMVGILLGEPQEPVLEVPPAQASQPPVSEQIPTPKQEKVQAPVAESAVSSNSHAQAYSFPSIPESPLAAKFNELNLNILMDIPLQVSVELGRATKKIKDILELTDGSVVELDKLAGEPVNILVNDKIIAKGEVVVVDESFAVRLTEITSQQDRMKNLQ